MVQHDQKEQNVSSLELELCKSVTDQCADKGLDHGTGQGEEEGVAERSPIIQLLNDRAVNIQGEVFRNQSHGYVHEVLGAHDRARDLRKEREQNDVRNSDHQNETEDPPNHVSEEVKVEELCF